VTATNDGGYLFDNIVSGPYSVIVEQPGFARSVRSDIDVAASQTIRVDFALQVGTVGQEITVSGGTPTIETETPTISTQLRNNLMNQSAIAGGAGSYRVSFTFYHITPGSSSGIDQGNFNGLPTGFAERATLDGIRMPEAACCQIVPTAETLEEMKVVTHGAREIERHLLGKAGHAQSGVANHVSGIRRERAFEELEERGFSGPIAAQEPEALAILDLQA